MVPGKCNTHERLSASSIITLEKECSELGKKNSLCVKFLIGKGHVKPTVSTALHV